MGTLGRFQYSHNTASVVDNDYLELTNAEDIDEYRFNGVAGQRVGVAFDALGLGSAELGGTFVRLLNSSNAVLAQATTKPLSITSTVANYDLGLVTLCTTNYRRLLSSSLRSQSFDYYLAITKNLALDTENSTGSSTPVT